jgi:predicted transcriptional regulator
MKDIINKLEELREYYNLKERHIEIIRALNGKELSADEISEKAEIPKGRIYDFLNELLELGLINKINTSPALFNINDFNLCVNNFLNTRFNRLIRGHIKMYNLLEGKQDVPSITYFLGGEAFMKEIFNILSEKNFVKVMCMKDRVPFFLYPIDPGEFKKSREIISKSRALFTGKGCASHNLYMEYLKFLQKGNEMKFLLDRGSLERHFENLKKGIGKKSFKKFLLQLKNNLKNFNLKIDIAENPFYIHLFLSDKKVVMNIVSGNSNVGVTIESNDITKVYEDLYESYLQKSIPIQEYLKKLRLK